MTSYPCDGEQPDQSASAAMLHVTHTRAEGTLLDGTARGDGTADLLKGHGWRWSRELGQWYVPRTRERGAPRERIEATIRSLGGFGFEVTVELDDAPRSVVEVEAAHTARQVVRAERLADRARRAEHRALVAEAAMRAAEERVPTGGEPVKVGHHSEGRHRRALERAHRSLGVSVEADREAHGAAVAAEVAAAAPGARYSPVAVANRLVRLEADHRALVRRRDGWTRTIDARRHLVERTPPASGDARALLEVEIAETLERIAYWREIREQQQASGSATAFTAETVRPGDRVQISGIWRRVVRASAKSVTVKTGYSWNDRAPWHTVQAHESAPTREASK